MNLRLGKYRHFKGNEYEVMGIAKHSESGELMAVYKRIYNTPPDMDQEDRELWFVRPLSMFTEEIDRDGMRMPRFQFLNPL